MRFFSTTLRRGILACALACALGLHAGAAASNVASCERTPEFHLLDFWVGKWDVVSGKNHGLDVVEKQLDGCAVTEKWDGGPGDKGFSLFYFNRFTRKWTQVWVTNSATSLGGLKEKYFVGSPVPGAVRFQGTLPGLYRGKYVLDRTTLSPMPNGRVHQVIETSTDGGATWHSGFDAIYVPMK